MISLFLAFFLIFTFVLYPLREYLHPQHFADQMQALLPSGFKGLIAILRNWTFTLFYVMCELWGTAIMSVLFWGFMNEVTKVDEAKRYYGILMIVANASSIIAGQIGVWLSSLHFIPSLPYGSNRWEQSILFLNISVIICGILTAFLFRYLHLHFAKTQSPQRQEPEKIRLSMRQNFAYLAKSKYLICIAAIVLTYNVAINLVEVVWKNQIHAVYPDPIDFQTYMGTVTTWIGVVATFAATFITGNVLRRFSWTASAMISPMIMLITGLGFFGFTIFENTSLSSWTAIAGFSSPLIFALFLGSLQNIFARTCKYTFFDATKEIAFIPLNPESKLKGKAAIDGIGSRLGKSGGSIIHTCLLLVFTTVSASTPLVAAIFLIILLIWILAIFSLGKQFEQLTKAHTILAIPEDTSEEKPLAT